jgi:hypothetical protein
MCVISLQKLTSNQWEDKSDMRQSINVNLWHIDDLQDEYLHSLYHAFISLLYNYVDELAR